MHGTSVAKGSILMNKQASRSEAGYSLAELLTVVAIVGVMSLVTIPSFIGYFNSNKVKSAMRAFTSDLRTARAMAITQSREVKVTFTTGANQRAYDLYLGDRAFGTVPAAGWTPLTGAGSTPPKPTKNLDNVVYFPADNPPTTLQTFITSAPAAEIIFFPDGHVRLPTNAASGTITIMTDMNVPKPSYAITISPSGRVLAQ